MPRQTHSARLSRLDELTALLQSGELTTVRELATALQVTPRTVTRDIELLRERGMPIESSNGRGGGIRLYRRWSLSRIFLDYHEALGLLLALALSEKLDAPLMLKGTQSIRNKLLASFNPAEQARIHKLRHRILVAPPASEPVRQTHTHPVSPAFSDIIQKAFFEMHILHIEYQDGQKMKTARQIEPQYLLISWPVWYLLTWDHLRNAVRAFRLDRILSVTDTGEAFTLRPESLFTTEIADISHPI